MRIAFVALLTIAGASFAASTRVPPEATQAAADRLLDSAAVVRTAARLAKNPRVSVTTIGRSAGGRPIVMLAITEPGERAAAWPARARQISGPAVRYRTLTDVTRDDAPLESLLPSTRLPVLLAGTSWGHEAAQVEGLLAAAETLAGDRSAETSRRLSRVVALIIPLMNPDGRDRAIAEWRRTPLSNGDTGVGNDDGFMLNRDFVHQTQPESQAVLAVTREWRPVVGIDFHEDVNSLGHGLPEVAFVPPYMPGFDVEEDPGTRRAIVRVGDAIAKRWRDAGFSIVHDPEGDRRWVPVPPRGSGALNPVAGSSGRLEFLWTIHSITGLITESARTPGTQRWEDRVAQKKIAALAAVEAVGADPSFFARTVYERRRAASSAEGASTFVAIPDAQPSGADRRELVRLLRAHDVLVYRAEATGYDVVPLTQPERPFIEHALLARRSKLNDLGAALGVTVSDSGDSARSTGNGAIPAETRHQLLAARLELEPSTAEAAWPKADRPVPVAVYRGQGIDEAAFGELIFVLRMAGFSPAALVEDDVRDGRFGGAEAIIFGDGVAREIVDGWDPDAPTRKAPWQIAAPPKGIGRAGVDALARFVRDGGRVITIGRSAGLVAPGLVPITVVPDHPGIGEVRLRIAPAARWLVDGAPYTNDRARAFLYAPPDGRDGGYVFKAADQLVAAWYDGVDEQPDEQSFADTKPLLPASRSAAVVSSPVGRGRVTVFGFSPAFRAQWRATFPMLFNAIVHR